jgi:hypothetical protein
MAKKKKTDSFIYEEPISYFPKEIREKYKLGEFCEEKSNTHCGGIPGPTKQDFFVSLCAEKVADEIRKMPEGSQSSISILVDRVLENEGYEKVNVGVSAIHAWKKESENAKEFLHEEDYLTVFDEASKLLEGEYILDFSQYENKVVGLPYNLRFTVRKQK